MGDVQTTLRLNDQASSVLQRVANSARQTASAMQQTGRAIDQAFRSNAPNAFASQVGSAMNSAASSAESLGNAINDALDGADAGNFTAELESGMKTAASATDEFSSAADEAGEAVGRASESAKELGDRVDGIGNGNGLEEVGRDASEAGAQMDDASGKALNLGNALKAMAAAIGVAKIAHEAGQFIGDSISLGKSYTAMMSEVAAISGATGSEFQMLESTARQYGATTVFSASEAAEALKFMSLAGWDANQSANALGGVLDLAAASGMGLGQASDMVTDYLSAFGMEASQAGYFADMLAYAQANSNTSAEQLGQAYLNSAANLHSAGQDIETTTSLLEAMANQGTKGARAGTQLAAIARDITNSMEDGQIQIGKTSVAVQDQYGNFRDLTDILTDVEAAVDGMGSAERAAALAETFTADSTKGINQILTEGMSSISRYEEELRNSTGAAGDAAATMNDNLQGDLANMNSAFEEMQLQVFEGLEGSLREGAQYVTGTVIPALTEWVPQAVGAIGEVVGKIGSALAPVFTTLLKNPKAIGTALATLGSGFLAFKAMTAVPGIITGIGSAITSLWTAISAHPFVAGATALVAAIVAIKGAVDQYNELEVQNNLKATWGDLELSDAQVAEVAGGIVGADWVANINLALGEFQNAEQFHEEAEEALKKNEALIWEARVQTAMTHLGDADPAETYAQTIQDLLHGRETDGGLTFDGKVITTLEPNESTEALTGMMVDAINLAITNPGSEEFNEFVGNVATTLNPDDPLGTQEALIGLINGIVAGAPTGDLDPYVDTVIANLDAEDGGTFLTALAGVTEAVLAEKLPPELKTYEDTITISLTPEMQADYKANIESYLESKKEELNSLTFASTTAMQTVLGDKAGQAILSQMQQWAAEDSSELEGLSQSLTTLVENALSDGVLDVNEQAAIDILQSKINNIFSTVAQNQADAEWKALETRWNGRDITADSFVNILSEAQSQRQTAIESLNETTTYMYGEFSRWLSQGHIDQGQYERLMKTWDSNYLGMEGESIGRSLEFAIGQIKGKQQYADVIAENLASISNNGAADTMNALNKFAAAGNGTGWEDIVNTNLLTDARHFWSEKNKNSGIREMYEAMIPDVNDMQSLIDTLRDRNQKIPEALMQSFNEAIEMGAAAGNESAAWQHYANTLLSEGNEQLVSALRDPNSEIGQQLRSQMAPELAEAIDRALYAADNTVESIDMSALFGEILGLGELTPEVDLNSVNELLNSVGMDISDYIASHELELDANGMKMKLVDFDPDMVAQELKSLSYNGTFETDAGEIVARWTVNQDETLSGIADQLGVSLETLQSYNQQIFDERGTWDLIYPGDVIYSPEVDVAQTAEKVGEAADEAQRTAQAAADSNPVDITEDANVMAGETAGADTAGEELAQKAKEQAETAPAEPATKEIPGSITINLQSLDDAELQRGINEYLANNQNPIPVDVPADVTIEKQTDNIAEIYEKIGKDLDDAFRKAFTPPAEATIELTETNNVAAIYSEVDAAVTNAFARGFSARAIVQVELTANYRLANPTKTITFSGGAEGSATVTASLHALGGYFDQAHLGMVAEDGPEYIIPMDGSDRSRDMWTEAGSMLGMIDKPIETMPGTATGGARGNAEPTGASKDINLNINGSGSMTISSNLSKEDILDVMMENVKGVLMGILQEEILTEGEAAYVY